MFRPVEEEANIIPSLTKKKYKLNSVYGFQEIDDFMSSMRNRAIESKRTIFVIQTPIVSMAFTDLDYSAIESAGLHGYPIAAILAPTGQVIILDELNRIVTIKISE